MWPSGCRVRVNGRGSPTSARSVSDSIIASSTLGETRTRHEMRPSIPATPPKPPVGVPSTPRLNRGADLPPVAVVPRPVARAGPRQARVGPPRAPAPRPRRPVADLGGELAAHVERRRPVGHEFAHVPHRPQPAGALRRRPERRRHVERQSAPRLSRVQAHGAGEALLVVAAVLVGRQHAQRRVDRQPELRIARTHQAPSPATGTRPWVPGSFPGSRPTSSSSIRNQTWSLEVLSSAPNHSAPLVS